MLTNLRRRVTAGCACITVAAGAVAGGAIVSKPDDVRAGSFSAPSVKLAELPASVRDSIAVIRDELGDPSARLDVYRGSMQQLRAAVKPSFQVSSHESGAAFLATFRGSLTYSHARGPSKVRTAPFAYALVTPDGVVAMFGLRQQVPAALSGDR